MSDSKAPRACEIIQVLKSDLQAYAFFSDVMLWSLFLPFCSLFLVLYLFLKRFRSPWRLFEENRFVESSPTQSNPTHHSLHLWPPNKTMYSVEENGNRITWRKTWGLKKFPLHHQVCNVPENFDCLFVAWKKRLPWHWNESQPIK